MKRVIICAFLTGLLAGSAMGQEHKISVQKFEPPVYPPIARQAHIVGEVKLQLRVAPTGEVIDATVISGHRLLQGSALENIKKWRFHCDDCRYGESFGHVMTCSFFIDDEGEHESFPVAYKFPNQVIAYTEPPVFGTFAPDLPKYFWLWKILHPRYWRFHGFD